MAHFLWKHCLIPSGIIVPWSDLVQATVNSFQPELERKKRAVNKLHQMRLEKGGQGTWHRWRAFGDRSLREKGVLPHPSQSTRWNKTSGSENRSPIHRLEQGATPVPWLAFPLELRRSSA